MEPDEPDRQRLVLQLLALSPARLAALRLFSPAAAVAAAARDLGRLAAAAHAGLSGEPDEKARGGWLPVLSTTNNKVFL